MKKYKCILCGEIFEAADDEEAVCPVCSAEGDDLELLEKDK